MENTITPDYVADFLDDNFRLEKTSGGYTAWTRPVNDTGWRILITDASGTSHEPDFAAEQNWLVGAQCGDTDLGECFPADTVAEALEIADRLHAEIAVKFLP